VSLTITILGCGSSGGVPRMTGDWGSCDPKNPKNRRRRCSIIVEQHGANGTTRVLIDTSPDMREQILDTGISAIDGVWYTHEHADHTHGIDELRGFFLNSKQRVPVWADASTLSMLTTRFAYCFIQPAGSDYPPILKPTEIIPGHTFETNGAGGAIATMPIRLVHGAIDALGFRIGNTAYTPDLNDIPDESIGSLEGLDLWIVDALRRHRHPSHFSLPETLAWIERLKPKRAIITNMHNDMDYDTLRQELPAHITPAYDGMRVTLTA
jgi:phosphoribosyl 1,2-cyclic phosphate phosphodiesterase